MCIHKWEFKHTHREGQMKMLEIKDKIIETGKAFYRLISRPDKTKEDRPIKINQTEIQRRKIAWKLNRTEQEQCIQDP